MLVLYQLLRMAMVTAVETRPGTDPDRASFTTAMEAARDQLTAAAGICPDGPADLTGVIGRAVLATLLPARRARFSARRVKCATARYLNRDDGRPAHPATITAIDIAISTPPVDLRPGRTRYDRSMPRPPRPPTRRDRVTAIITSHPPRDWSGHDLAVLLKVNPGTCSPSSANGHGWGSSPAPASAPTASTCRPPIPPRQTRPIPNFAALLRDRLRRPVTEPVCRQVRQLSGSGEGPGPGQGAAGLPEAGREMVTGTRASRCHQLGATLGATVANDSMRFRTHLNSGPERARGHEPV